MQNRIHPDDVAWGFPPVRMCPIEQGRDVGWATGLAVLIVHADPLVGLMLEELLREGGVSQVTAVTTENHAAPFVASGTIDAAILGISRNNAELLAVARLLTEGRIPFMISGALTPLPDIAGLSAAPVLRALASSDELLATLALLKATH